MKDEREAVVRRLNDAVLMGAMLRSSLAAKQSNQAVRSLALSILSILKDEPGEAFDYVKLAMKEVTESEANLGKIDDVLGHFHDES